MSNTSKFDLAYRIKPYEVDQNGNLSPFALCTYLQDAAGDHARQLGFGARQLPEPLTWMLTAIRWKATQLPKWDESGILSTWPSRVDRLYAYRDYSAIDNNEYTWFRASTRYVLLDMERRRPVALTDTILNFPLTHDPVFETPFSRLSGSGEILHSSEFRVRFSDVDLLRHTNNAVYAGWIAESVPEKMLHNSWMSELELLFKSESVFRDQVRVETARTPIDRTFSHAIVRVSDGARLAVARSVWSS